MSGGNIGGMLGTGAGAALAPFTGGASLPIGAALGAAGGGIGAAVGGGNPLTSALMGGVGGLLGADATGSGFGGLFGDSASASTSPASADLSAAEADTGSLGPTVANANDAATQSTANGSLFGGSTTGSNAADQSFLNGASNLGATPPSTPPNNSGSFLGSLGNDISKSFAKNPLPYLGLGVAGIGALTPAQGNKINYQQTLANQKAMNPGFYANLPQYNMTTQTASPTSQNWYTYGQRPQTPIYTSQITPQSNAQGGLVQGFARGGKVCGFAMGGQPMAPAAPIGSAPLAMPPVNPAAAMTGGAGGGASPMGAPSPPLPMQQPDSPLASLAGQLSKASPQQAAQVGHKLGQALRQHIIKQATFSGEGAVSGQGGGQDDAVPAKLSDGEYVHSADVVSALGDGSTAAGAKKLAHMDAAVRAHKTSHGSGFPPKAHSNPLSYVKKGGA